MLRQTLFLVLLFVIPGCAMSPDEQEKARVSQVTTPLPVDPSDNIVIGPWWSNGRQLLNLRADGGYSIYDNNNRYARPMDRGRWGRQNFATLWLMPYTTRESQRIRAQVVREDSRFGLSVPEFKTMFPLESPPSVMEDQLVGQWQGTQGTLTLHGNLTYVFAPADGATAAGGTPVVGHNGKWRLAGDRITLSPTTPSVPQQSLSVKPADASASGAADENAAIEPTMEGMCGTLTKTEPNG